jgi:hypothetical protein
MIFAPDRAARSTRARVRFRFLAGLSVQADWRSPNFTIWEAARFMVQTDWERGVQAAAGLPAQKIAVPLISIWTLKRRERRASGKVVTGRTFMRSGVVLF